MPTSKILVAGALLASIFGLTACGGGNDSYSTTNAVVLNIPDPVQPVAADVTIGGVFAGGLIIRRMILNRRVFRQLYIETPNPIVSRGRK